MSCHMHMHAHTHAGAHTTRFGFTHAPERRFFPPIRAFACRTHSLDRCLTKSPVRDEIDSNTQSTSTRVRHSVTRRSRRRSSGATTPARGAAPCRSSTRRGFITTTLTLTAESLGVRAHIECSVEAAANTRPDRRALPSSDNWQCSRRRRAVPDNR